MVTDRNNRTILITKETHSRVKDYCDEYGFKLQGWIDHVLREKLDKLNK